jgi:rhamnosyltransferase
MNSLVILMATYNGGEYIKEQIDSILNQTYTNWELYIRDDGSSDNTVEIIKDYCNKNKRVHYFEDKETHIGAKNSFLKLLENVDSDLYMFCDQDDVWLPTKIEHTLSLYNEVDNYCDSPIVIHTDAELVDAQLNTISKSYWKSSHIVPERYNRDYTLLAIMTCTQGTTMLFNDKAKKLCFPYKDYFTMHDWWVSTRVLKNGGHIEALHEATILYRQHSSNVYGVSYGKELSLFHKIKKLGEVYKINRDKYLYLKEDGYGGVLKFIYNKLRIVYYRFVLDR